MKPKPYNHSEASLKRSKDFGTANKAAALIARVFLKHTKEVRDETFYKRLKKLAIEIINTGSPSQRGNLQFIDGNLDLLTLFPFNPLRRNADLVRLDLVVSLEKTDFLRIRLPALNAKTDIHWRYGTTSIVLRFVVGIFHFDLGKGGCTAMKDIEITTDKNFPGAKVDIPLQSAENSVVCLALCTFFKNGKMRWDRPPGKCHSGEIIRVFNIIDGKVHYYKCPDDLPRKQPLPSEAAEGLDWEINE